MKRCIIFNPTARGDKALRFRRELESLASQCTLMPTDAAGAGRRLAKQAALDGFQAIIAAGGDGTVNEVLNGIVDAAPLDPAPKLGVIPLGTVNVFAKELKLPTQLARALDVITQGYSEPVDIPVATLRNEAGGSETRVFAQLGGAGLDSRAIARVRWSWKKKIGPLAYVAAGLEALRETAPCIEIQSEEANASGELVLIGNGRYYGGRIPLFPDATLSDGKIDVVVFPRTNVISLMRFGCGLLTGNPFRFLKVTRWQTRTLSLRCNAPMPFELDGDNVGFLPATITVSPKQIDVLMMKRQ